MDFDEFQKQARRTSVFSVQTPDLRRHYLLAGLTAQVGEIANRLKKQLRDGADYVLLKDEIAERIGHSFWYAAMLADELGISLGEVARNNTAFNQRRWSQLADEQHLIELNDFDGNFPSEEQLPQKIIAEFQTVETDGINKTWIWIYPDWPARDTRLKFGNEIDDNSTLEDHYRYHDVFHFAYVAFLWWSPVVRALLRKKRKSVPDIDRIQDGARAKDTEEAATAFIYSYVSQQSFLETSTNIDTGLLTAVRTLLRAYEVSACLEKEWERAILEASRVLRELVANRGGWIVADRKNRKLSYYLTAPEADR